MDEEERRQMPPPSAAVPLAKRARLSGPGLAAAPVARPAPAAPPAPPAELLQDLEWTARGSDVVRIRLVADAGVVARALASGAAEFEDEESFAPTHADGLFPASGGDVVGYRAPRVRIYLCAVSLAAHVAFAHDGIRPGGVRSDGCAPTDVLAELARALTGGGGGGCAGLLPSLEALAAHVAAVQAEFNPLAAGVRVAAAAGGGGGEWTVVRNQLLASSLPDGFVQNGTLIGARGREGDGGGGLALPPPRPAPAVQPMVAEFFDRLEFFSLALIDFGLRIDERDPRLELYVLFECRGAAWRLAGFSVSFLFFAFPDRFRMRISQFAVLPPVQRRGYGERLLGAVLTDARARPEIRDVTVEVASPQFVALRNRVELRAALDAGFFRAEPRREEETAEAAAVAALDAETAERMQRELKVFPRQAQVLHDIVRFARTAASMDAAAMRAYRVQAKQRLLLRWADWLDGFETVERRKVELASLYAEYVQEPYRKLAAMVLPSGPNPNVP